MLAVMRRKRRPTGESRVSVNILIVDDDDSIRDLFRAILAVEDNVGEVREAANGADAVRVVSEFSPDVIVLDFTMPGMDGEETVAALRDTNPNARIVAFSGVLQRKPDWADDHYVKGDLPDMAAILEIA
jgi:chemotaxis response regulator CheB